MMTYGRILGFVTAILIFPAATLAATIHPASWMASLDDTLKLSALSIPGTHDSASNRVGDTSFSSSFYITQYRTSTIRNQLDNGVRFLDIRCNQINDACAIHHGAVYLFQNLTDVLSEVYGFLDAHKSETVIMSIKDGEATAVNNTLSFSDVINNYIKNDTGNRWYVGATVPRLGDVRGKIVLMRRFGDTKIPLGINASSNWPGNTDGSWTNSDGVGFIVQDYYNVPVFTSYDEKKRMIVSTLDKASSPNTSADTLILNFTSAYSGIPNPQHTANIINPVVKGYFEKHKKGRFGIVPMDFMTSTLSHLIYMTNF
jgi:1-phosphatidylinositol phosphodiesterase